MAELTGMSRTTITKAAGELASNRKLTLDVEGGFARSVPVGGKWRKGTSDCGTSWSTFWKRPRLGIR